MKNRPYSQSRAVKFDNKVSWPMIWPCSEENPTKECWTKIHEFTASNHLLSQLLRIAIDLRNERIAEFLEVLPLQSATHRKEAKTAEKSLRDNIDNSFPAFHLLSGGGARQSSAYTDCTTANRVAITTT